MKAFGVGCGLFVSLIVLMCLLTCLGCFGDLLHTARQELSPSTLLGRYEYFKDLAASLDAKLATIKVYEGRFKRLNALYVGKTRTEWAREDREQANLWEQEVAGIRASYNQQSAIYNSLMSKENFRFCNVGALPEGASAPLPREYRPYLEE